MEGTRIVKPSIVCSDSSNYIQTIFELIGDILKGQSFINLAVIKLLIVLLSLGNCYLFTICLFINQMFNKIHFIKIN